ncbi:MAG: glucose 1-dehydrogenase [Syntrophobacteraceae bacterium]|nr:glucose 1-dehydrogenase [Syntrophobacteraceae bacterium]
MRNQVVLITGALTGIGHATAVAFAEESAKIVVSGRHEDRGEQLVEKLRGLGVEAEFIKADVRSEEDVKALIDKTVQRFGRLDVAVNNAGTEGKAGPIVDQTAEAFSQVFSTNVLGVLLCLKYEMRAMREQKAGSIVNLSSVAGLRGFPGASVYVASKHAVEGLTKVAALEGVEFGIRVNSVAPGPIDTEMFSRFTGTPENRAALIGGVPMNRIGKPEEVAAVIRFLASPQAAYITGASFAVDGGAGLGAAEQKPGDMNLKKAA